MAAGLLGLNLIVLTLAFFVGRLVSFTIYMSVAVVAEHHLGEVLDDLFGSPWSIALQVALLGAVSLVPLINWRSIGERRQAR